MTLPRLAVPGPGLLAGISGAAGNPLFVIELLGALAQEGVINTSGGRAEVAEMSLPPTLRLTILRRHALATLAGCWDRCAQLGLTLEYRMFGPDLVRLALACGDRGRARDVAVAVAEIADGNQEVSSFTGAALRSRGLAEENAEILYAAVSAYARGPRPLELALTSEEAGKAFAQQGMMDRAQPLLRQAIEIYERLDAARDLARAEAVLRAAGIRRGRRGARSRPQTGWQSLTPAEHTIATLVAEGLSNPQIGDRLFVSRRTVQTHLAHVFTTLDITSRAQLAAEVTAHREQPAARRH